MGFDWTVTVFALATAIIVQDLPRAQVVADISTIAKDCLPVVDATILAQFISDVPASVVH